MIYTKCIDVSMKKHLTVIAYYELFLLLFVEKLDLSKWKMKNKLKKQTKENFDLTAIDIFKDKNISIIIVAITTIIINNNDW